MEHNQRPRRARPAPFRSPLIAVLCLAVFLPLVAAGPAQALSGYATPQPAVNAQYPDTFNGGSQGGGGDADGTLRSLMTTTRRASSPKVAAQRRQAQRRINRQARGALSSAAGLTPTQSGSLILLFGAALVMSVGAILRWRRGLALGP